MNILTIIENYLCGSLSADLFVSLSLPIYVYLSAYLSMYLFICLHVCLSINACTTGWLLCPWISSQHLKVCLHAMSFSIVCIM